MGVEPFLITSSLTLVVGQRLARVPCEKCSEPVEATPRTLELLGLEPEEVAHAELRMGPGCGFCSQTGYKGRMGLFEVVRVTRTMRELIVARASETAMREEAVVGGMRSMRSDGLAKALVGRTTLEEVLRVTPPDPERAKRAGRQAATAPTAPAVKVPPKVLVLDDDRAVAEVAAAMMVDGYEVLAANEVAEGLRMVEGERPDVVVVNLDLPGVDVVELLASLRAGDGGEPAVLVAADPRDHQARDRALAAGATGFVAKPLVEAELRAEVAAALGRRPALT
jgi:CheY-like chemotaxis protein